MQLVTLTCLALEVAARDCANRGLSLMRQSLDRARDVFAGLVYGHDRKA